METRVLKDATAAAVEAARFIAQEGRGAVAARGRFVLALSGGSTPLPMFRALADQDLPWPSVYVAQVDERVAPAGHPDRNLTHLSEYLLNRVPLRPEQIYPMPVEAPDLDAAAAQYAQCLRDIAGTPPVFDLIHLGLGADGHTASLVPGDPVLDVSQADVALTQPYQGRRRMTLTYPAIDRARRILWLATDAAKAEMILRLTKADPAIPAGRVHQARALLFTDRSGE
jgi:6-phosphogluconolactonase